MKRVFRFILFLFVVGAIYFLLIQNLDLVLNLLPGQSKRVIYERVIKRKYGKEALEFWKDSGNQALQDFIKVEMPYRQEGFFLDDRNEAFGYRMELQEGQKIDISINLSNKDCKVFLSFLHVLGDNPEHWVAIGEADFESPELSWQVERTGEYFLNVQSGLKDTSAYMLQVLSGPSLTFPVSGKGNKAIQSFWGDPRDGGRRSHEGIDIFAPKGTPVVACAEGRVSRVKTGGLGGKVIWLKSTDRKFSFYYAHLDSRSVRKGQFVHVGDEIGKVGNTGNASTTPPHLHFGVYKSMGRPIDPLPFVRIHDQSPQFPIAQIPDPPSVATTIRNQTPLRAGTSGQADLILTLGKGSSINILGASRDYFHVRTEDGVAGFVRASLL